MANCRPTGDGSQTLGNIALCTRERVLEAAQPARPWQFAGTHGPDGVLFPPRAATRDLHRGRPSAAAGPLAAAAPLVRPAPREAGPRGALLLVAAGLVPCTGCSVLLLLPIMPQVLLLPITPHPIRLLLLLVVTLELLLLLLLLVVQLLLLLQLLVVTRELLPAPLLLRG